MKLLRGAVLLSAVAILASNQAKATTYSDSTGDQGGGNTSGIMDITSVEVNNTATDLIFKINLAGDPVATDWGKYMIGIDSVAGGDTASGGTTSNGWGRPISMSSGMDYWAGSWVDSGNGRELYQFTASWANITPGSMTISKDTTSVTLSIPLASLGLIVGNSFDFDVYTSGGGGGDGAIDALANPGVTIANWGDSYDSALKDTYTVVPEPSTMVLVAFGGLALIGRLFRRRA